jgi:Methyltransferase domain
VDASEAAIDRARSVTAALGLDNVELFAGDLHDLGADALGGPFDVAFTRLFLMHQPDPARTLRHIAGRLRAGGTIVAHEALRSPAPRSHPHLEALGGYWELLHTVMQQAGLPALSVERLPRSAHAAGLDVVEANGFFTLADPLELGFELHAATVAASRERAIALGVPPRRSTSSCIPCARRRPPAMSGSPHRSSSTSRCASPRPPNNRAIGRRLWRVAGFPRAMAEVLLTSVERAAADPTPQPQRSTNIDA